MDGIKALIDVMARLRDPNSGCPWDIKQTFQSITPYTIEEAYEVADAIERNDMADFKEELGDLLLQVVFHSQMAKEQGLFDVNEVAQAEADKLVSRHPHVFGDQTAADAEAVMTIWNAQKDKEKAKSFWGRLFRKDKNGEHKEDYEEWFNRHKADRKTLRRQRHAHFAQNPLIRIVIPLYCTPIPYLKKLIDSVCAQT